MSNKEKLRMIPAVHEIQHLKRYEEIKQKWNLPDAYLKESVQELTNEIRNDMLTDGIAFNEYSRKDFINYIISSIETKAASTQPYKLRRVLNGTGTVLHTNLGRARLSEKAIERVVETSRHYSNLEYDVEKGGRGSRHAIVDQLIKKVTGAEAAMVVNNNAAAVYLVLRALTKGKEVIVSRGELVEIGGSFRISTIMEESDAKLVEVGTTNKTHLYDYEHAVTPNTAMFMKVHTSNFKTIGFTKEVLTSQLKELSNEREQPIIVYEDLGSGSLYPFKHDGIGDEPVVKEAIKKGADIVSFSGDKLLGGPQAGVITGKKEYIDILKKHSLARVLRVDKMTLAALEATLQQYLYERTELEKLPTNRDILQTIDVIRAKVEVFLKGIDPLSLNVTFEQKEVTSHVGGGTMPGVEIPSIGVKLKHKSLSAMQLEEKLRSLTTPIITRVVDGEVFIDFRTIAYEEIDLLFQSMQEL